MATESYSGLQIAIREGVASVTIDHPPINLFDPALIADFDRAGRALAENSEVKVVVLQSANPDFFIAHADVLTIQRLPPPGEAGSEALAAFHQAIDRFRTMPKATIAKIEGRCRGGGKRIGPGM